MLNYYALDRAVKATAKRAGLRVQWERSCTPSTDGKTVYLPIIDPTKGTEHDYESMLHFTAHEVSHVLYTDFEPLRKGEMVGPSSGSVLGTIFNITEDHRVDALNGAEFEGDRLIGIAYHQRVTERNAEDLKARKEALPPDLVRLLSLMQWAEVCRGVDPDSEALKAFAAAGDPVMNDVLPRFIGRMHELEDMVDPVPGTAASWKLACDIFEALGGDVEQEIERAKEEAKKAGKTAEKGDGDGEKGEGEGKAASGGAEEGEKEEGDKEGESTRPFRTVKWDEVSEMPMHGTPSGKHEGIHMDWEGYDESSMYRPPWVPTPPDQVHVVDYKNNHFPAHWDDRRGRAYLTLPDGWASSAFAAALRVRLQTYNRARYEYGLKQGRLNSRAMYRVGLDAPGVQDRLFKKKQRTLNLDNVVVSVLVDASGSMGWRKWPHAAKAAILLNESIGNVLHVPLEIISFTDAVCYWHGEYGDPVHCILRAFNDAYLGEPELHARFADAGEHLWDNADGDSILWTYNRLIQHPHKKKVMIVLSDGAPSTSRSGDIYGYTKRVCSEIQKAGLVDLYGIGIMDRNVERFYKNATVIDSSDQLETKLLEVIDSAIMKGVSV